MKMPLQAFWTTIQTRQIKLFCNRLYQIKEIQQIDVEIQLKVALKQLSVANNIYLTTMGQTNFVVSKKIKKI